MQEDYKSLKSHVKAKI